MIKRKAPKPHLHFEPVVTGAVHLMKERDAKTTLTKCGVIADRRSTIHTTAWASEITCPSCRG